MKRTYLSLILLLFPLSSMLAQTIQVNIDPVEGSTYEIVKIGNDNFHAIENAKCVFSVEGQVSNILWHKPEIKKNGNKYATDWNKTHSGTLLLNLDKDKDDSGEYELFLDSITYTLSDGNKKTVKYDNKAVISFQITLYEQPRLSDIFTTQKEIIWDNTTKTFNVKAEGGNTSGWKFKWMLNGREVGDEPTWSNTLSEAEDFQELKVEIKNFAPDNETLWFDESSTCSFKVYPYPQADNIELQYRNNQCPSSMNWYCEDESMDPISVSVNGYDEAAWSCQWKYKDNVVSRGKSFRPSIDRDEISSYDEGTAYTYSANIKIQPEGMVNDLARDLAIDVTVNFWKTPEITLSYDDYKVVFDNAEVLVGYSTKGGIPGDERTIELFLDEVPIEFSKKSDKEVAFYLQKSNNRVENKTYILRTRYENANTSVQPKDIPINLILWKTPILHAKYKSNNPVCKDSLIDANSEIFVCEKFESNAELHVSKEHGDNNEWTYSWVECSNIGNILSTDEFLSVPIKKANGNAVRSFTYRLVATNKPSGMKVENKFTDTVFFNFIICPTPSIDLNKIKSEYAGMHGEKLQLSIENAAIGVGGEWIYVWQKKGDDSPIDGSTLGLVNEGTEVIQETWIAKPSYYGPLGDIWYGDDNETSKSFSVKIYPSPKDMNFLGFDQNRIDAFYEGEKQYSVGFEGDYRYATNWIYTLYYNDEVRKRDAISHESLNVNDFIDPLPFDEDSGYSKSEVKLQVTCYVYDDFADVSLIAYNQTDSLDYFAWRKGMAEMLKKEYPTYIYYDEVISLGVNHKFGYEDGWEFEWKRNGLNINENKPTYDYKCGNTTKKQTVSYSLHCVNRLKDEVSYDSIFEFSFDEYAKIIKAELNGDYSAYVREGDTCILSVKVPKNGNPDGWEYNWEDRGEELSVKLKENDKFIEREISFELSLSEKENEMYNETVHYALHYSNKNPDGKIIEMYILPFEFTVYRKPKLLDFIMKGDGTSSIYIAQSPSKKVQFEFGQGELPILHIRNRLEDNAESENAVGIGDSKNAKGEYMAFRYPTSPDNPWVRTFWDYDSIRCYSDPLTLEERRFVPSRKLEIEDGYFCVNLEEEVPAMVTLYTINGELVKEQYYAPRREYAEKLDIEGISKGMYILKCTVGDMQVVKKLMIR